MDEDDKGFGTASGLGATRVRPDMVRENVDDFLRQKSPEGISGSDGVEPVLSPFNQIGLNVLSLEDIAKQRAAARGETLSDCLNALQHLRCDDDITRVLRTLCVFFDVTPIGVR